MKHIAVVLLAAGRSRRFGSNKLNARLDNNESVLRQSQQCYASLEKVCFPRYYLVANGTGAAKAASCIPAWEKIIIKVALPGIGVSIAHAVREISRTETPDGYLIGLADMPFVRPETITRVVEAFDGNEIVRPQVLGDDGRIVQGHPVLFSSRFFDELVSLKGDTGAKSLLKKHHACLKTVSVQDAGILWDIDTPEDLMTYQQKCAK